MTFKNTIILLVSFTFTMVTPGWSQTDTAIKIGPTITIHSQFKGLPVVEPNLSVHPANQDHLLIAAMVITDIDRPYQSARLSTFVSQDGGTTWQETAHNYWGYDPWAAILADGKTAMSWLGTPDSFQHQFPIRFFSSADGGIHWDEEVQTIKAQHGHDGTKIVGYKNDFYFTTVRFTENMGADVILYRRTGDERFREVAKIDGKGLRLNFCEPAVLSDGTVLVPGSQFLQKLWVQPYYPGSDTLAEKELVTLRPGGAKGYIRLVADTSGKSAYQDRVYVVRALGRRDQYEGVWLNYSSDKGRNWSPDIRVDHFSTGLPSQALLASIAVNRDGVVGVSWVDRQQEEQQKKQDVYFTYSTDGGASFIRPVRITDISVDPRTPENGNVADKFTGGGHYLDIKARLDGSFQLVWSDSRSGFFELQTCTVALFL